MNNIIMKVTWGDPERNTHESSLRWSWTTSSWKLLETIRVKINTKVPWDKLDKNHCETNLGWSWQVIWDDFDQNTYESNLRWSWWKHFWKLLEVIMMKTLMKVTWDDVDGSTFESYLRWSWWKHFGSYLRWSWWKHFWSLLEIWTATISAKRFTSYLWCMRPSNWPDISTKFDQTSFEFCMNFTCSLYVVYASFICSLYVPMQFWPNYIHFCQNYM